MDRGSDGGAARARLQRAARSCRARQSGLHLRRTGEIHTRWTGLAQAGGTQGAALSPGLTPWALRACSPSQALPPGRQVTVVQVALVIPGGVESLFLLGPYFCLPCILLSWRHARECVCF